MYDVSLSDAHVFMPTLNLLDLKPQATFTHMLPKNNFMLETGTFLHLKKGFSNIA